MKELLTSAELLSSRYQSNMEEGKTMKENAITTKQEQVNILIKWIMFTAAITGMALISAFYPVHGNIPLIIIPSIIVLIFAKPVFFEKLKLTTLVIMRIVIVFAALNLFGRQLYVNLILWMLIVNILEATFTDLLRHKKYLNAISGFALALGVFSLSGMWAENAPMGNFYIVGGVVPSVTLCYVIGYTLWNWIFVTDEFSEAVSLMHVGFLSAPIIGGICTLWMGVFGGLSMWLLLRANSLAIGGWMQIGAKQWFETEFYSPRFAKFVHWTHKTPVQVVFMIINIALMAYCLFTAYKTGTLALPSLFV